MTDTIKQDQKAGNNSINVQVNNHGLSLSETQQLVKQEVEYQVNTIMRDNFIKLQNDALACANTRANELTQMFFDKLLQLPQEIVPQVLERLKDPDMQMSIWEAQKGYIKSGNKDKLQRISLLLRDKISEEADTLKSYLIDEALVVIPKLTKTHIDFLTCIMYLSTTNHKVVNWKSLKTIVLTNIVDLCRGIQICDNDISYLSQLKCLEQNPLQNRFDLYKILEIHYKGLFAKGLEEKELNLEMLNKIKPSILIRCINDPQKYQINALNEQVLKHELQKHHLSLNEEKQIKQYFDKTLPQHEIKAKIENMTPSINEIAAWLNQYSHIFLTPLGMLIAISNYREKFKENITWNF